MKILIIIFVGASSTNYINKFIDHVSMISEKKGKYQFIIVNTDAFSKQGDHGQSLLNFGPKTIFFSLILLVLMV